MSDGSLTQNAATPASQNGAQSKEPARDIQAKSGVPMLAIVFVSLAIVAAIASFVIVRAVGGRRPTDPTTERIQELIDEANRLLAQLDEKHPNS